MPLDLATAKLHLRVSDSSEDTLIGLYLSAATDAAQQYLNRTVYAEVTALAAGIAAGDLTGILTNASIEAAILLMTGHLYASREDVAVGVSVTQLPSGSHALLNPYRTGLGV